MQTSKSFSYGCTAKAWQACVCVCFLSISSRPRSQQSRSFHCRVIVCFLRVAEKQVFHTCAAKTLSQCRIRTDDNIERIVGIIRAQDCHDTRDLFSCWQMDHVSVCSSQIRTLRLKLLSEAAAEGRLVRGTRNQLRMYLTMSIAAAQPVFMYWLTCHLVR